MIDLFLKTETEAEMVTLLDLANIAEDNAAIDVIGIISRPTGQFQETEFGSFPVYAPIPGWHVNLRGEFTPEQIEALAPYCVSTARPHRVFA